jgi:hypothetical protein
MTDLTNKIGKLFKDKPEYIQKLINDYKTVLEETRPENIPYIAYIIYVSVKYINSLHQDLSKDLKAWSVIVIKNLFLDGKIKKETDILQIIDDFIGYYTAEYEKYCENIIAATEFDRDNGFVLKYLNKKNR